MEHQWTTGPGCLSHVWGNQSFVRGWVLPLYWEANVLVCGVVYPAVHCRPPILLYIGKGVPVAHRPTKRSPSRHFRCGLVRNECRKKSNKCPNLFAKPEPKIRFAHEMLWLGAGRLLTWVVGIRPEQASQTLVFSFCAHNRKATLPVGLDTT